MIRYHRSFVHLSICGALVTLVCVGCGGSSPEAKKAKHRERAATYLEKGQYQEAIIEYKNVAQLDPKDADAHYQLALAQLKLGGLTNLQGAFAELKRSTELDNTNQDAQLKLGELYLLGNEPNKARQQADIVLVSTPQNTEGLLLRGRSLINEQRYPEGMEELKKAIDLDPKNMHSYIELARAYLLSKDPDSAEAVLKQALAIEPRSVEIVMALGDLRLTTGKPEQAEAIYKQALDIAPQNEEIYLKLASFYQRSGKWSEVETIVQQLASLKPQDEKPHIYLGDFSTWLGQKDKALASYQRATEVNPSSLMARNKLIAHYLDTGKTSEAEARVKDILAKNSKDLDGRFFDARIRLAMHNTDEAISLLQGVLKDEPTFAGAQYFLGVAFMQKGQTAQARGAFTEAVKLNPNLPEPRTALAEIYLADGSPDMAIEQAQAALQLNPRNVPAAIISGDAYLRKGDFAKSRKVYEAIAQALPKEPIGPYRLGLVARAEKNDPKALAYFEEALNRKPAAIEPLAQIVMIKQAQGKANEARERVMRQIDVVPNSSLLYDILGQLWLAAKDLVQAEQSFRKAIDLDNSLLSAYMHLGQTYHRAGKIDQAAKEFEAVLAKDPKVIPAHMVLGTIHDRRTEYDKAQVHYEAILKLDPRFAPAANNLAWILVEQGGNLDVALSHAQMAREQQPNESNIADTLGWIYYKKNANLLALNLLKEAVEKLPNEPAVHFHYGMAQQKNGDQAGAKKSLQTALKLSQTFDGSEEARKTLAEL
ncbi:MAG: tetratricopeptide repeat protein [Nitrospirae bacterium]|nr:tetratricopeptide repeat protein [Nitrospirota bacterium]